MFWYLIVWRNSDGNDCTVIDSIVRAKTEDNAFARWDKVVSGRVPNAESDYNGGYYYPCTCEEDCERVGEEYNPDYCEGHGGFWVESITQYDTRKEAESNRAYYHCYDNLQ